MSLRWRDSWHKKVSGISLKKCCRIEEALPKEEGDVFGEKAMHEENILSSWLRKDVHDKKGRKMEAERETEEDMGRERGQEKRRKKRTRR